MLPRGRVGVAGIERPSSFRDRPVININKIIRVRVCILLLFLYTYMFVSFCHYLMYTHEWKRGGVGCAVEGRGEGKTNKTNIR